MNYIPFANLSEDFQHFPIIISKLCILLGTKGESLTKFIIF